MDRDAQGALRGRRTGTKGRQLAPGACRRSQVAPCRSNTHREGFLGGTVPRGGVGLALGGRALRGHSNEPFPPRSVTRGDWPQLRAAEHQLGTKLMLRQASSTHRDASGCPCPAARSPGTVDSPQRLRHRAHFYLLDSLVPAFPEHLPEPVSPGRKASGREALPWQTRTHQPVLSSRDPRHPVPSGGSSHSSEHREETWPRTGRGWPRGSCSPAR